MDSRVNISSRRIVGVAFIAEQQQEVWHFEDGRSLIVPARTADIVSSDGSVHDEPNESSDAS